MIEVNSDEQREDQHESEGEDEEVEEMDESEEQQEDDDQQQIQAEVEEHQQQQQQQREYDQTQDDQPLTEEEEQNAQRLLLAEFDKLVLQKQELSRRMEVAKIGGEVLDQCLAEVKLKRELEREKAEHLEQALKDLEKARDLQMFQEAKTGEDLKWQKEMMANFSEFCEEDDEEDKALAECAQQAEEMAVEFEEMRQNEMPWIAEKASLQKELELEEDRMTQVYEQISEVDKEIAVVRSKLAGHEEIPFKTFCLTLAEYHQKSTHLEKLIMREHKIGKELDAKLQERRTQNAMLSSQDSAALFNTTLETSSNFSLDISSSRKRPASASDLFQQQSTSSAAGKSVRFGPVNTKLLTPSTVSAEGSTNTNGGGGESDFLFKVPELLPKRKRRASPQLFDFSQEEEEPQLSGSNSQPANGQDNRMVNVNLSTDNLSFLDNPSFLGDDDNAAAGEGDDAADAVPSVNMFEHFHFGRRPGTFSRCFLCERTANGRRVVLKKVLLVEADLLFQLGTKHPHVLGSTECYSSERSVYMVMEWMPGGNLHAHIRRQEKPFKDKQVLAYTAQLAKALEYVHGLRIVHRDVKPRNILLSTDYKQLKLCDFGIAVQLEDGQRLKGRIGQPGTSHYMAPEMLNGCEFDFKVDIWALGCVVYELVERKQAFPGGHELAVFNKICQRIIQWPQESKLNFFIKLLLNVSPNDRPTAKEVQSLVETFGGTPSNGKGKLMCIRGAASP